MAVEKPSLGNLPRRGPAIQMTAMALKPPSTWTVAAPPGSRKPAPREKLTPSWASHPPPQIQCAARGKTRAARRAAAAQPAVRRQRSAPEPQGMRAAKATARNSKSSGKLRMERGRAQAAEQKRSGAEPVPRLAGQMKDVAPAAGKAAGQGRAEDGKDNGGDGDDGQVAEQRLRSGAGAAKAGIDERHAGDGERREQQAAQR